MKRSLAPSSKGCLVKKQPAVPTGKAAKCPAVVSDDDDDFEGAENKEPASDDYCNADSDYESDHGPAKKQQPSKPAQLPLATGAVRRSALVPRSGAPPRPSAPTLGIGRRYSSGLSASGVAGAAAAAAGGPGGSVTKPASAPYKVRGLTVLVLRAAAGPRADDLTCFALSSPHRRVAAVPDDAGRHLGRASLALCSRGCAALHQDRSTWRPLTAESINTALTACNPNG